MQERGFASQSCSVSTNTPRTVSTVTSACLKLKGNWVKMLYSYVFSLPKPEPLTTKRNKITYISFLEFYILPSKCTAHLLYTRNFPIQQFQGHKDRPQGCHRLLLSKSTTINTKYTSSKMLPQMSSNNLPPAAI